MTSMSAVAAAADEPFEFDPTQLSRAADEVLARFPETAGLINEMFQSMLECITSLGDDYGPWDD